MYWRCPRKLKQHGPGGLQALTIVDALQFECLMEAMFVANGQDAKLTRSDATAQWRAKMAQMHEEPLGLEQKRTGAGVTYWTATSSQSRPTGS